MSEPKRPNTGELRVVADIGREFDRARNGHEWVRKSRVLA